MLALEQQTSLPILIKNHYIGSVVMGVRRFLNNASFAVPVKVSDYLLKYSPNHGVYSCYRNVVPQDRGICISADTLMKYLLPISHEIRVQEKNNVKKVERYLIQSGYENNQSDQNTMI